MKKSQNQEKPKNRKIKPSNIASLICCAASVICLVFNLIYTTNAINSINNKIQLSTDTELETKENPDKTETEITTVSNNTQEEEPANDNDIDLSVSNVKMLYTAEEGGSICGIRRNRDANNQYAETVLSMTARIKNNTSNEIILSKETSTFQIFNGNSRIANRCRDDSLSNEYSIKWYNSGGVLKPNGEVEYGLIFVVPRDLQDTDLYLVLNAKNGSVLTKKKFNIDMYKASDRADAF